MSRNSILKFIITYLFLGINSAFISHAATPERSDTIDIVRCKLHLNITDYTNKTITGFTEIDIRSKMNNQNTITFDLLALQVDSVVENGINTSFIHTSPYLKINLTTTLQQGDSCNLKIYYHGAPFSDPTWGGFTFSGVYAFNMGVGFSSNPHPLGRSWFPCFDNFNERSFYEFFIETPLNYKAVCNGLLMNHTIQTNTELWHWKFNQSVPSYLVGVAVAPYKTMFKQFISKSGKSIPVELSALATDTLTMKNFMNHLHDAFDLFENKFCNYQWDKVGYVLVPFNSGAMEHASNIAYGLPFIGNSSYESIYPHELSHMWFGDLITCQTSEDMWLNEGWASYCEQIYFENIYSKQKYIEKVKENHLAVITGAHLRDNGYRAVANMAHEHTYGTTVYDKGSDMIHTLRTYMGDIAFYHSLQQYFKHHQWKNATTLQFRDSLIKYSGNINLINFFSDWILQPGFPNFVIADWKASGINNSHINLNIVQSQLAANHAYKDVPASVTFFNENMQSETHQITIKNDGCNGFDFNIKLNNPICALFDYEEKLSDASTTDAIVIKSASTKNLVNAKLTIVTNAITDSAFIWAEHHWVRPNDFKMKRNNMHLADRFWVIDGVFKSDFDANIIFQYNGSKVSATTYDSLFISNSEDSLVLMYRPNESVDWEIDNDASLNTMGSITNKMGNFTTKLKRGEYALAIYDYNWHDLNATPFKTNNCNLSASNKIKNESPEQLFYIYPNPAKSSISIKFLRKVERQMPLSIYNNNGQLVQNVRVLPHQQIVQIDLNDNKYPSGIYFISTDLNLINENIYYQFEVVK